MRKDSVMMCRKRKKQAQDEKQLTQMENLCQSNSQLAKKHRAASSCEEQGSSQCTPRKKRKCEGMKKLVKRKEKMKKRKTK